MNSKIKKLTIGALIMALSYIGFQFLRIDIPIGGERTAIHLGNAFVVLGALLQGPLGGLAGALGLTLADLTSGYVSSAPKTFILKLVMGLLAAWVAKLTKKQSEAKSVSQTRIALISSIVPLSLNVILDPLFGYVYKKYLFGLPQDFAVALAKISSVTTLINTIVSVVIVTALWPILYKSLNRT